MLISYWKLPQKKIVPIEMTAIGGELCTDDLQCVQILGSSATGGP